MSTSSRRRVLVVDDEVEILALMKTFLSEWDFEVLTCISGNEALMVLASTPVDLIISDLTMPNGDGEALLRAVGAGLAPHPPVILVTARDERRSSLLKAGAFAVHGKPCNFDELRVSVTAALAGAG